MRLTTFMVPAAVALLTTALTTAPAARAAAQDPDREQPVKLIDVRKAADDAALVGVKWSCETKVPREGEITFNGYSRNKNKLVGPAGTTKVRLECPRLRVSQEKRFLVPIRSGGPVTPGRTAFVEVQRYDRWGDPTNYDQALLIVRTKNGTIPRGSKDPRPATPHGRY
ncbi:hypothetical protein [Nonomuraea dietziae]|uniref:hypothetical protein n=1 Tax=Nonomuraea dietziae TaxID=65515 RepID=UPI0033FBCF56